MAVRLGIDTGGTFTDLIGINDVTGDLVVAKTLYRRNRADPMVT